MRNLSTRALVIGIVGLIAVTLVVVALVWPSADPDPALPAEGIPAATVLENPERYIDQEITVTGEVSVLTDRIMSISDEDLIIVSRDPASPPFNNDGYFVDDTVYATGELVMLDAFGVTQRLPHVSLLQSQFQGFERQPVLLASEVVPAAQ